MATEYAQKQIFTLDSLRKAQRAQRCMYDSGIVSPNSGALEGQLSTLTAVLGIFAASSTPASLALGVVSLATDMLSYGEKEILKNMVYEGQWQLGYMDDFMVDNPKFDRIEINLPWIEYNVNGKAIKFITGKGVITRCHSGSGWEIV